MSYFDHGYPRRGTGYGWTSSTTPVKFPEPGLTAEIERDVLLSMIEAALEHNKDLCDKVNEETKKANVAYKTATIAYHKSVQELADKIEAMERTVTTHRFLFWTWTTSYQIAREDAVTEAKRKIRPPTPPPMSVRYHCFDDYNRLTKIQTMVMNEHIHSIRLPETDLRILNFSKA